MRLVVVTGTGTGIGKTITSAMVIALALAAGQRSALVKPVQTGVLPGEPGDAAEVSRLAGLSDIHELVRYDEPLAPATAARRLGESGPEVADLVDAIMELRDRDLVVVEGAGGALVRLNSHHDTILDLASALITRLGEADQLEVLMTVSAGLGTLHSAAATSRAIRDQGLALDHVVIGDWPEGPAELAQRTNLDDLPEYSQAPLHGIIRTGAGLLSRDAFRQRAETSLTRHLGGTLDPAGFVP